MTQTSAHRLLGGPRAKRLYISAAQTLSYMLRGNRAIIKDLAARSD